MRVLTFVLLALLSTAGYGQRQGVTMGPLGAVDFYGFDPADDFFGNNLNIEDYEVGANFTGGLVFVYNNDNGTSARFTYGLCYSTMNYEIDYQNQGDVVFGGPANDSLGRSFHNRAYLMAPLYAGYNFYGDDGIRVFFNAGAKVGYLIEESNETEFLDGRRLAGMSGDLRNEAATVMFGLHLDFGVDFLLADETAGFEIAPYFDTYFTALDDISQSATVAGGLAVRLHVNLAELD